MKIPYPLPFLAAIILLSCSSEEAEPSKLHLTDILQANCPGIHFDYQDDKLVSVSTINLDGTSTISMKFHYDEGRLSSVDRIIDEDSWFTSELEYDATGRVQKQVISSVRDGVDNGVTYSLLWAYDQNGNLQSQRSVYDDVNNYLGITSEFEWNNGNLTKATDFYWQDGTKHILTTSRYQYDNMHNYANRDLAFYFYSGVSALSRNNVVSSALESMGEAVQRSSVKYGYNEQGYPVKSQTSSEDHIYQPLTLVYK